MLEIKNLSVAYDGIAALRDVSLSVSEGRMVALIGPNGAGKSSLLNTISGIVRAQEGSVLFRNEEMLRHKAHTVSRLGLLHVPEGRRILGPLTVEENLVIGSNARGKEGRGSATRFEMDDVFELFPILKDRRSQAGGSLSGGQQQMLAIGRALMGWPWLLMLDEPSLGLSPLMAAQVFEALAKLRNTGLTILLVEQNAMRALASTDQAYVLEQGRIVRHGESAALLKDPHIVTSYLPRADG